MGSDVLVLSLAFVIVITSRCEPFSFVTRFWPHAQVYSRCLANVE